MSRLSRRCLHLCDIADTYFVHAS